MSKEFETKILDINTEEIDKKLLELGAKKIDTVLMRRWVYDWVDEDPELVNEWIRLREHGDKTTLTYKNKHSYGKIDTEEIEVEVDDFDKTASLLSKIPFKRSFYQENKRTQYNLDNMEFMIDVWPKLKPHLEVEGKIKEDMEKGLELLGLKGKEVGDISVNKLYEEIGIHLHSIKELKFEDFEK